MHLLKKILFGTICYGIVMVSGCGKTSNVSSLKDKMVFGVLKKGALTEKKYKLKNGKLAYLPTIQIAASAPFEGPVFTQLVGQCKQDFLANVIDIKKEDVGGSVICRGSNMRRFAKFFYDVNVED